LIWFVDGLLVNQLEKDSNTKFHVVELALPSLLVPTAGGPDRRRPLENVMVFIFLLVVDLWEFGVGYL
jgi:hypothetical protein